MKIGIPWMRPEIKAAWVAALRSGDYKQGRGQLRRGDQFCCLGVLCNLHALAHPDIARQQLSTDEYMGQITMPPAVVDLWAGFDSVSSMLRIGDTVRSLAYLNDSGATFEQIADAIEEQL